MINHYHTHNQSKPLLTPDSLIRSLPATPLALQTVTRTRRAACDILQHTPNKLLVIVGPCSIHDTKAALHYAEHLKKAADQFHQELLIIMRVYFEKPRTTIGWRGLINDPHLDGSHDIESGLTTARTLLLKLNELGMPAATEFLDPITPLYLTDLIAWSVIGARTAESQLHRQIASGLPMPVGFKNSTDGNIDIAIDAIKTASHPHHYVGLSHDGHPAVIHTPGNPHGHIILRGGRACTNYAENDIANTARALQDAGLSSRLIVDCSHGNSKKNHLDQLPVANHLIEQLNAGASPISGVMLESHLQAGKQALQQPLTYGQSITDACLAWEDTLPMLEKFALAVRRNQSS
jgi:3-deoxy-7-phosphoheptulonate synthase